MPENLPDVLKKISPDDIRMDSRGRVIISNPEITGKIAEIVKPNIIDELAGNGICCGNGNCLSEALVRMLDRVTGGR